MTEAQNGLPKSRAELGSQDTALNDARTMVARADGESCGDSVIDEPGELGARLLLLSRLAA